MQVRVQVHLQVEESTLAGSRGGACAPSAAHHSRGHWASPGGRPCDCGDLHETGCKGQRQWRGPGGVAGEGRPPDCRRGCWGGYWGVAGAVLVLWTSRLRHAGLEMCLRLPETALWPLLGPL